jgi:hypothetical protein
MREGERTRGRWNHLTCHDDEDEELLGSKNKWGEVNREKERRRGDDLGDRPEDSLSQSAMLICNSSPGSWEVSWID